MLTLALKPSIQLFLEESGKVGGLEEPGGKRWRLREAGRTHETFLQALLQGGQTEEALCGNNASLPFHYLLAQLEREGWLRYTLIEGDRSLATLEPVTPPFRFQRATGNGSWRLSRFAWAHRLEGGAVLEHPLGSGRILLHDPEVLEWVGSLCHPQTSESLALHRGLPPAFAGIFLSMLFTAGAVAPCEPEGQLAEDLDPALRQWEFHDLLFHCRSRQGKQAEPAGATLRFLGEIPPLPGLKPIRSASAIPLPEPSLPQPEPSFFTVLEARHSVRAPGREPITLLQLGTFLHHVARVRGVAPPNPEAGHATEVVSGPCPGGGGLHELELYLTVTRCAGLAPGFYHYAAGSHALEPWPGSEAAWDLLLRHAQASMGGVPPPDILFTLAARFQRVSWKYQSIAYALILKNTGVWFQQMYLVATALGLAPCAIGAGNTQVFAQASGLDAVQESSVGEFSLNGV